MKPNSPTGNEAEILRGLITAIDELKSNASMPADSSDSATVEAIHMRRLFSIARVAKDSPQVTAAPSHPAPSEAGGRPRVVCLCGSSKHPDLHMRVMMAETLAGRIVIPMGLYGHADFPAGAKAATNDGDESTAVKQMLDTLHHRKIDAADEILVITVQGYIGNSTRREIEYAQAHGKLVRFSDHSAPAAQPTPKGTVEVLRPLLNNLMDHMPNTGGWDNECPLCNVKVPHGDLKHTEECPVTKTTALLARLESEGE